MRPWCRKGISTSPPLRRSISQLAIRVRSTLPYCRVRSLLLFLLQLWKDTSAPWSTGTSRAPPQVPFRVRQSRTNSRPSNNWVGGNSMKWNPTIGISIRGQRGIPMSLIISIRAIGRAEPGTGNFLKWPIRIGSWHNQCRIIIFDQSISQAIIHSWRKGQTTICNKEEKLRDIQKWKHSVMINS